MAERAGPLLQFAMQWQAIRSLLSNRRVCLGVDFGTSQVKMIALQRRGGRTFLQEGWMAPVPREIRTDAAQRREFYRQCFRDYLRQSKIPFLSEVALNVSGPEVAALTVLVPRGTEGEIQQHVEAELGRVLGYPLEQATWIYGMPPEPAQIEGERVAAIVLAAPTSWIQELSDLCRSFQLVPAVMMGSPFAINRLVVGSPSFSQLPDVAVLDLGFSGSHLFFIRRGVLEFLRMIPVGTDHLVRGLMRTIATPQGGHTILGAEAEEILRTYGVGLEEPPKPMAGLEAAKVYGMLRSNLEYLFLEIQRTLHYYSQTFQRPIPERILAGGGGACVPQLIDFLNANLDATAVEPLDPLDSFSQGQGPSALVREKIGAASPLFSCAIGAVGLEPALPPAVLVFQRASYRLEWVQLAVRWIGLLGMLVTLALTAGFWVQTQRYRQLTQESQARIGQLEERVLAIQEVERLKKEMDQQEALIAQVVSRQPLWEGMVKELSRITPDGVRLISLTTIPDSQPLRLRIQGEILPTYSSVEVLYSLYQLTLEKSAFFSDIQLVEMRKDVHSAVPRASFEVTCRLVY